MEILILCIGIIVFMGSIVFGWQTMKQSRREQTHALETMQREMLTLFNERLLQLEKTIVVDMNQTHTQFGKGLRADFESLNTNLERRLLEMQNQVDVKLNKGFAQTTETFQGVLERLTKIDQAQKKIDALTTNIGSLQDILNDKKARGTFGEVQLVNLFKTVFGVNDQLYRTQYTLSNKRKVDLMLFAPEPMGNVAIDSKFPLENYRRMIEEQGNEATIFEKQFKNDLKKHINDIAEKYIILNETAEYAIMFIPAEAVFAHVNAYYQDIVDYGYRKKVWLTSPTTLMAMLTTIQVVLKNIERDQYAQVIRQELEKLSLEFARYQSRWQSLAKHIKQVSRDVDEVNTTSNKISSRFSQIKEVEFTTEKATLAEDIVLIENSKEDELNE